MNGEGSMENMSKEQFGQMIRDCYREMEEKQEKLIQKYGVDKYAKCWFDFDTNMLKFYRGNKVGLELKAYALGTWTPSDGTWLWAWADPDFPQTVKEGQEKLKELYGNDKTGLFKSRGFVGNENKVYEAVSITLKQMNAMGVYKIDYKNSKLYLAIMGEK